MKKKGFNAVFVISLIIVLAISIWGIVHPASFGAAASGSMSFITNGFGWLYVLGMTLFVAFAVWLGFFSKYRSVRLGHDDSRPQYSNFAWFGMLFSAGLIPYLNIAVGMVVCCTMYAFYAVFRKGEL